MSYTWEELKKTDQVVVDAEISYLELSAMNYLRDGTKPPVMPSFEPISQPNEHNLHSAARVAAGLLILMMLAGVSWLFWLKASQ